MHTWFEISLLVSAPHLYHFLSAVFITVPFSVKHIVAIFVLITVHAVELSESKSIEF